MKNKKIISITLLSFMATCSLLVTPTEAIAKQQVITLKQTVETKQVLASAPSPDGNHIAYTLRVPREVYKAKDGVPYVELHIVDGADHRALTNSFLELDTLEFTVHQVMELARSSSQ